MWEEEKPEEWRPDAADSWERAAAVAQQVRPTGTEVPGPADGFDRRSTDERRRRSGRDGRGGSRGEWPSSGGRRRRGRSSRRRRRRLILFLIAAAVVVFGGLVADAYYHSYLVYKDLRPLQTDLSLIRRALSAGKIPANDPFEHATAVADDAAVRVQHAGLPFRIVGAIPFLDRPVDAVRLAAEAAQNDGRAASIVRSIVSELLGPSAFQAPPGSGQAGSTAANQPAHGAPVFRDGVVDVHLLVGLAPRLRQVEQYVTAADAAVRRIPSIPFAKFEDLRTKALDESARAKALADRALSVVRLVPSFFGVNGERTYFVAFQQNAALRGTGGSVLAYALLKVRDGALSIDRFGSIYGIDNPGYGIPVKVPAALQWYVTNARVNPRIANGMNYSPDFPMVAQAWARQVEAVTGEHIDGALAMDPFAVSALIEGAQPIKVDAFPDPITAKNVVQAVEHDQFELPTAQQKIFPGELINRAFNVVLLHPPNIVGMLHRLGGALEQKRIQIWTDQTDVQDFFRGLNWDGATWSDGGDYLNLVQNNRVGNKIDWWGTQKITYTARLTATGGVDATYQVALTNGIPTPISPGLKAGQVGPPRLRGYARDMMSLYIPKEARFMTVEPTQVTGPGADTVHPPGFVQHIEGDFRVLTQTITAGPAQTAPLTFRYTVPNVVRDTSAGHVYVLTVQHQPLANPADLTVRVILPKGASPVDASGWTVKDGVATYHGTLTKDLVLRLVYS